MKKKILLHLFLLSFLFSCSYEKKNTENEKVFYYLSTNHNPNYTSDTLDIKSLRRYDKKDSLIAQHAFEFKKKQHVINVFTNYLHAPIDGGTIYYELDDLGIIYLKSTTWFSYYRLKSTNDSINNLIEIAFENILLYEKLYSFDLEKMSKEYKRDTIYF